MMKKSHLPDCVQTLLASFKKVVVAGAALLLCLPAVAQNDNKQNVAESRIPASLMPFAGQWQGSVSKDDLRGKQQAYASLLQDGARTEWQVDRKADYTFTRTAKVCIGDDCQSYEQQGTWSVYNSYFSYHYQDDEGNKFSEFYSYNFEEDHCIDLHLNDVANTVFGPVMQNGETSASADEAAEQAAANTMLFQECLAAN